MNAKEKLEQFSRFGSRLGLERMSVLMELLGNPQEALRCIHVAGTNGKGSCCRYLYEALMANGYKTGLYTSPFIEVFNERIQLDGEYIKDEDLEEITRIVLEKVEIMLERGYDSPTEFEVTTACAFKYFQVKEADIVILEVGLGGLGDSTNIISSPLVSIITSISYDHTDRLGDDIRMIAAEKAGIIKKGCPVISNAEDIEAKKVIAKKAYESGSLFYDVTKIKEKRAYERLDGISLDLEIFDTDYSELEISMTGAHQIRNLVSALSALELLRKKGLIKVNREDLYRGLKNAVQIGRFEILAENPYIILDGAHNEDGAMALASTVNMHFKKERVLMVCGILRDKDVSSILAHFKDMACDFIACEPESDRRLSKGELKKLLGDCAYEAEDTADAVNKAMDRKGNYDAVIFAGSLYLIGEIRRMLKNGAIKKE